MGIAYGLQIPEKNIIMRDLQADNLTDQGLDYITTLGMVWIPSNLVNTLTQQLASRSNNIYHNPDANVNTIMSLVSPLIITSPSLSPSSTQQGVVLKVVIGVLVPLSAIAVLVLVVAYRRQNRRKKYAILRRRLNSTTKDDGLPAFIQQKPELNGEDHRHEMSTNERWMELHGEGRQELQGEGIRMELHGEGRQELPGEAIRVELHG